MNTYTDFHRVLFTSAGLLLISGNPGEIQYYEEFLRLIFDRFEEQVEVVGISHAGHHAPPLEEAVMPPIEGKSNRVLMHEILETL